MPQAHLLSLVLVNVFNHDQEAHMSARAAGLDHEIELGADAHHLTWIKGLGGGRPFCVLLPLELLHLSLPRDARAASKTAAIAKERYNALASKTSY